MNGKGGDDDDKTPRIQGELPLAKDEKGKTIKVGYETGCPGAEIHIGLRFEGQPKGALDGKPFPDARWEQSPFFTLPDLPIEVAGITGVTKASLAAKGSPKELDKARWLELLSKHRNVKAKWFVAHDTGGGSEAEFPPSMPPPAASSRSHLFLHPKKRFLNLDFSSVGQATRFEWRKRVTPPAHDWHHPEFVGLCIHVEMWNPDKRDSIPNPVPPPGDYAYDAFALAYIFASYRAREWLTVTCHIEMDRGISGAHGDPRGFKLERLYAKICAMISVEGCADVPKGSTFGILDARIGNNVNLLGMRNTFPAQYGKVVDEEKLTKK